MLAFPANGPHRERGRENTVSSAIEDRLADRLRGFGPFEILAIVVIVLGNALFLPLSAILVLVWARWSRTPWREIGYVWPGNWAGTVTGGILLGIALEFLMKAIVMPVLGADPINHANHDLAGNRAALPGAVYTVVAGAGFGEETVIRAFLLERVGRLLGSSLRAKTAIVLTTPVLFGLAHYSGQGLAGVEQATITGLVFGTIFAATGRTWMPMIARAAFGPTALWTIYTNLGTAVAGLVFKYRSSRDRGD